MPNWCHNNLRISGKIGEVDRFIEENQGKEGGEGPLVPLLFSKSFPEPDGDSNFDWYSWRVANWGTKWEPNFGGVEKIDTDTSNIAGREVKSAIYRFDTAWGPADGWMRHVAKKYPSLVFCLTYGEAGMDFGGTEIYVSGELSDSSEGKAREYLSEDMFWF